MTPNETPVCLVEFLVTLGCKEVDYIHTSTPLLGLLGDTKGHFVCFSYSFQEHSNVSQSEWNESCSSLLLSFPEGPGEK